MQVLLEGLHDYQVDHYRHFPSLDRLFNDLSIQLHFGHKREKNIFNPRGQTLNELKPPIPWLYAAILANMESSHYASSSHVIIMFLLWHNFGHHIINIYIGVNFGQLKWFIFQHISPQWYLTSICLFFKKLLFLLKYIVL